MIGMWISRRIVIANTNQETPQEALQSPLYRTLGVVFVILYLPLASSHLSGYARMQGLAESAGTKHGRGLRRM